MSPSPARTPGGSVLARGLLVLLGAALLMLLACATVELAAVAFASGQRAKAASGLLLVAWGAGSFLGGLLLGSRARRLPLGLLCWISAASFALLCVAASAAELAALLFCSGMTLAPMLSRLYGLVGERAIGGRSSEVFGWLTGALAVGAAAGTALGGEVVDRLGAPPAFLLAAVLAAAAGALALTPGPSPAGWLDGAGDAAATRG